MKKSRPGPRDLTASQNVCICGNGKSRIERRRSTPPGERPKYARNCGRSEVIRVSAKGRREPLGYGNFSANQQWDRWWADVILEELCMGCRVPPGSRAVARAISASHARRFPAFRGPGTVPDQSGDSIPLPWPFAKAKFGGDRGWPMAVLFGVVEDLALGSEAGETASDESIRPQQASPAVPWFLLTRYPASPCRKHCNATPIEDLEDPFICAIFGLLETNGGLW